LLAAETANTEPDWSGGERTADDDMTSRTGVARDE